jgi:hypothetical protein
MLKNGRDDKKIDISNKLIGDKYIESICIGL